MTAEEIQGRAADPILRARYHQEADERTARQQAAQSAPTDTQGGRATGRPATSADKAAEAQPEAKSAEQERFEELTGRFTRENIERAQAMRQITGTGRGGRRR